MATALETPSRIWRRIKATEERDVPSLPSIFPFEDSAEADDDSQFLSQHDELDEALQSMSSPMHSTPASVHNTINSVVRAPGSASSTARFAHSIASRSSKSSIGMASSRGMSTRRQQDSFDIPSLPQIQPSMVTGHQSDDTDEEEGSKSSVPDVYLPPEEDDEEQHSRDRDFSLTDALESVSRSGSPPFLPDISRDETPKKNYDFSVSLKSEPKASPFDKYRNVALRRTNPRARTPSLTRTSSSQTSSPTHSTPQSNRSYALPLSQAASPISATGIPLPRSASASPAIVVHRPEEEEEEQEHQSVVEETFSNDTHETRSMDITDVHISPPRIEGDVDAQFGELESQEQDQREEDGSEATQEEQEPTFSSEGDATPYALGNKVATQNISNFTSPSTSAAFTPTPAYPRPRARFTLPAPPSDLLATPAPRALEEQDEETQREFVPATPYNRPSFLMSVINSSARPRMAAGTPHPRRFGSTPSVAESTPAPISSGVSPSNDSVAFAGITPRPRMAAVRRVSHPLSQASSAGLASSSTSPVEGGGGHIPWATPAPVHARTHSSSPYDGTVDKASFISTASSHDLTTHHQRANTSFDPSMGFGAGLPAGRFNAGKLNTYLHGLNRRLQEENETLVERLKLLEEERKNSTSDDDNANGGADASASSSNRRLSGGSRRRSSLGTALGNVQEDVAEGWLEEKAELEEMVEAFRTEATTYMAEKEEVEKALEQEREERERDKVRWKERMSEVEEGVSGIIVGLEQKLKAAEEEVRKVEDEATRRVKEMERELFEIHGERDVAMERASKAERVLESGKELGGALTEANERIGQVMGDLRNANAQIKELEDVVMQSDARIDELEKELREDRDVIAGLEEELASRSDALAAERVKMKGLEDTIRHLDEELQATKAYAEETEEAANDAVGRINKLEQELESARGAIQAMTIAEEQAAQDLRSLDNEVRKARESARQMEEALEDAEQKMVHDEEALADLQNQLASLERERQKDASRDFSRSPTEMVYDAAEYQALEEELDEANKEKAKLRALLDQSPARKAIDKAKDIKIELLEREKEELLERNKALRMTFNEMNTPNKLINASGMSPIHRQVLSMSIRMPKTPGGPLRDMSWLNSVQNDASATPLISEIRRIQIELDRANDSIDDKLDKLENAGLDVVTLTKRLEDARAKIITLEDEISRLSRKDDRQMRRLERVRCQKCNIKLDLRHLNQADESSMMEFSKDNLGTEPPTPPTRTSEALKANLQSVNSHLDELKKQWEAERKKLLGEKTVLEDAASRLNGQAKNTKEEVRKVAESNRAIEKAKSNVQKELDKAKQTISVLETELGSERVRLRAMTTEQERMQRDKKQILTDMQRTESDMDDVKQQLQKLKKENHTLEKELRENVNAEQKARLLETRVVENADTIEKLRQERSLLSSDHKELQRRFSEVTENADKLRTKFASQSNAHDNHRQELDLHRLEIDDLRRTLEDRANDLQRVEKEKEKISSEKNDVARTVAALEADLRRVRRDAEAFGRDLKLLRSEKEKLETKNKDDISKAERSKKQAQAQIRLLTEQLDAQREKTINALDQMKSHVCAADENQVSKLKLQHNKECKGLIVQIRYLKARFTRESLFRGDLTYQKQYLLVLLQQFEKSERNIFASIARIGFPVVPPPSRRKMYKLKNVALMVVFLSRVKKSSNAWRQESVSKKAVAAALEEVRRKRVKPTT